jgi:hypothetical protein
MKAIILTGAAGVLVGVITLNKLSINAGFESYDCEDVVDIGQAFNYMQENSIQVLDVQVLEIDDDSTMYANNSYSLKLDFIEQV